MKTHSLIWIVAACLSSGVKAASIYGEISFNGGGVDLLSAVPTVGNPNPVTTIGAAPIVGLRFLTSPTQPMVSPFDTDGDYTPAIGSVVNFGLNPFIFADASGQLLWTAGDFQFYVDSVTSQELPNVLNVRGKGVVKAPGFDATPGTWVLTTQGTTSTVAWSSSLNTVPDGGATVVLLGTALAGVFGVRRFLHK